MISNNVGAKIGLFLFFTITLPTIVPTRTISYYVLKLRKMFYMYNKTNKKLRPSSHASISTM